MFETLKKIFKSNNEHRPTKEIYCGLLLKDSEGSVLFIEVDWTKKIVKLIDERDFKYTDSWNHLLDDVDSILYELEKKHNARTEKIIFFLYSHFKDNKTGKIQNKYLSILKELTKELELVPVGYIEHHEAINEYNSAINEMPLSAIIVEADEPQVSAYLYRSGIIQATASTAKTDDIVVDLENVLHNLKSEYLPTRIIIYDSSELEEETAKIMTNNWPEDLFIQIPHLEIYRKEKLQEMLLFAFKKQIFESNNTEFLQEESPKPQETQTISNIPSSGFLIGQDIASVKPPEALVQDFTASEEKLSEYSENRTEKGNVSIKSNMIAFF